VSVIRFRPLSLGSVERIFDLEYEKVASRYREVQKLALELTPRARLEMIRQGYSPEYGARPLSRLINQVCNVEVSKRLKKDERRDPQETGELLSYLREAREGARAFDPSAAGRIFDHARAHVAYGALEIDWNGRAFTYSPRGGPA
jgi:ClpA/ClpB-like protein